MDAYLADLYDDGQVTVTGLAVLSVVFTIFWTCLDFGCLAVKGLFRSVGVDAGERRQRLFFLSSIHAIVVTAFSGCVRVRHGCGACHCVQTRAAGLCELGLLRRALVSRARGTVGIASVAHGTCGARDTNSSWPAPHMGYCMIARACLLVDEP